jgi:hypothetical protein
MGIDSEHIEFGRTFRVDSAETKQCIKIKNRSIRVCIKKKVVRSKGGSKHRHHQRPTNYFALGTSAGESGSFVFHSIRLEKWEKPDKVLGISQKI